MRNELPVIYKSIEERKLEEETMSIIGQAYMVTKDYYFQSGGCDESLGRWGASGLEWSLKTWLTGGRVIVRTDVVCGHLFRENGKTPFSLKEEQVNNAYMRIGKTWRDYRGKGQTRPLAWLAAKFANYLNSYQRVTPETRSAAHTAAYG